MQKGGDFLGVTQLTADGDKGSTQGYSTGTYSIMTLGTISPFFSLVETKSNYFGPHRGEAEKLPPHSLYLDFPELGVDS